MNENFEDLKNRLQSADPADPNFVVSQSTVASAPLSQRKRAPLGTRMRLGLLSGASIAAVSAMTLVVSLSMPQQPLIQMASAQASGKPEAASMAADASVGAKMIAPTWIQYEHDGSALSDQAGRGKVYQLVLEGDPKQKLQELANFFGIAGEVREEEWSSKEYPTFTIGTQERQVTITWAGTGTFYFNAWDPSSYKCEKKTVELEDGSSYETCEPISTPELIPSEASIRKEASTIFKQFGLEIESSKIRIDRSEWGASAVGAVQVAGQDTALEWWLNYDGAGKLTNVYGHFAKPVERGEFNTVSPKDAAERIKDGRWFGSPSSSVWNQQAMSARAVDAPVGAAVSEPAPAATNKDANEPTTTDEKPIEIKPEIIKLKLISSEEQLLMIYDKVGGAWLVPGYLLKNDQGWFDAVISLVEGVIELPEPYVVEPMPATKQD